MDNKDLIEDVATLKEQARWHAQETNEIKSDLKEIKTDIKSLMRVSWRMTGAAIFAAFIATTLIEIFRR